MKPMKLTISKIGDQIMVDDKNRPGSPPVGYGRNIYEAVGSFFHNNQEKLGIEFDVEPSAKEEETKRRRAELDVT